MATTESSFVLEEFTDQFIKLDKHAIDMLAKLSKNASLNKSLATKLKKNFESNGIIEADATYEEVSKDVKLMKTLLKYLGQGLPDTNEKSNYGLGYLTDHNLYFNGSTDKKLDNLIAYLHLPHDTVVKLQKKRTALFTFVRKTRNDLLDNMELIGIIFLKHLYYVSYI